MKKLKWIMVSIPLAVGVAGCVRSHRAVYYTPVPGVVPAATVVAPTSDRATERVYSAPGPAVVTPPSSPPPNVAPADISIATTVSQLLKGDTSLADASQNIKVLVDGGVVTLRGTVPTDHDRDEIVERISRLPGVRGVRDELGSSLR